MNDESYFKADLFSALVRQLGRFDKPCLAIQFAEVWASRASPVAEFDHGGTSRDPIELAQRLIHDMSRTSAPPSSQPKLLSFITREKRNRGSEAIIRTRSNARSARWHR